MGEENSLTRRFEIAQQVRRPMTYFTLALLSSITALGAMYGFTSDPVPPSASVVMATLALCPSVTSVCVLLWAKAKLAQDPDAFKGE